MRDPWARCRALYLARWGTLALTLALPACGGIDTTEASDPEAEELRAFLEGTAPIPDAAGRDEHRRTLALLSVRGSGARRSGATLDPEEEWSPVVEQAGSELVPVDTRVWQRDGDIDASGALSPVRSTCVFKESPDLEGLPDEARVPELEERVSRLACALYRLSDEELSIRWTPGLPYVAVVDREAGSALVNPRWLALVEPEEAVFGPPLPDGSRGPGGRSPGESGDALDDGEPSARPLGDDDNSHHPRPTQKKEGGSSRTFCDRVCDDIWNDNFDCDCDGSTGAANDGCGCNDNPGEGGDGCDCGGGPGSGETGESGESGDEGESGGDSDGDGCDCGSGPGTGGGGGGGGALGCGRCSQARRGGRDRNGMTLTAALAGTLLLRRGHKMRPFIAVKEAVQRALRGKRIHDVSGWVAGLLHLHVLLVFLGVGAASILMTSSALGAPQGGGAPGAASKKLVDVHVTVTPPEAALFVDGNAVTPDKGIVRVPAGSRTFSAKLDGYATAVQTVEVPERGTGMLVTLRLVADKGYLIITGSNPALTLLIDGQAAGKGSYQGLVEPGNRVITAVGPGGDARSYVVTVIAGQSITVSTDAPPNYVPPPPPAPKPPEPTTPPPAPKKTEPDPPRVPPPTGPYGLISVTLVWQTTRPYGFEHGDTPAPGFSIGGRAGYRFNRVVGLEGLLEYGRIENNGFVVQQYDIDQDGDGQVSGGEAAVDRSSGYYLLESLRLGPVLRLATEGRENRFVGGVGLGAMHENIAVEHKNLVWAAAASQYVGAGTYRHNYEGWTPYLLFEGGYERSVQAFLMGVLFQITLESVSGIGGDPYGSGLQARIGLSLRGGYSLW